jgi:hypothetical protein
MNCESHLLDVPGRYFTLYTKEARWRAVPDAGCVQDPATGLQ